MLGHGDAIIDAMAMANLISGGSALLSKSLPSFFRPVTNIANCNFILADFFYIDINTVSAAGQHSYFPPGRPLSCRK